MKSEFNGWVIARLVGWGYQSRWALLFWCLRPLTPRSDLRAKGGAGLLALPDNFQTPAYASIPRQRTLSPALISPQCDAGGCAGRQRAPISKAATAELTVSADISRLGGRSCLLVGPWQWPSRRWRLPCRNAPSAWLRRRRDARLDRLIEASPVLLRVQACAR